MFIVEGIDTPIETAQVDTANKNYEFTAIVAKFGITNENGRVYQREDYLKHIPYLKEKIAKRMLMGELPSEEEVSSVFSQWEAMWENMDVFDKTSVIHQFIQQIDYNSAKGSLAISYEIK